MIVDGQVMICDAPDVTTFGLCLAFFVGDQRFAYRDRSYASQIRPRERVKHAGSTTEPHIPSFLPARGPSSHDLAG